MCLVQNIWHTATVLQAAPARHNAHAAKEVPGVVTWHADGNYVWLSLDGLLQLQEGQIVLKGGRLVVLVDDHTFHLANRGHIHILEAIFTTPPPSARNI